MIGVYSRRKLVYTTPSNLSTKYLVMCKTVNEYDQEIPQSQTAD